MHPPDLPQTNGKLFLLGAPRLELAGQAVEIGRRKALALLIYLAVNRTPLRRDTLATLFWPDNSQSSARLALSRHLSQLKQALGEDWFCLDADVVSLRQTRQWWVDVHNFQQILAQALAVASPDLPALATAVTLYRADFLSGFSLLDCPAFDDWQSFQSETLRQALAGALQQIVQIHLQQGDYELGITQARRWLTLDTLHEPPQRQLMTLYAHQGERSAALRQYEGYRQLLADELGVAPSADITALYERIRRGVFERQVAGGPKQQQESAQPVKRVGIPAFLQVPDRPAPVFVARVQELAYLQQALAETQAGECRPRFVIGGAGRGKTSLVMEFAQRALAANANLLVVSGQGNAHTGIGDPYHPWRAALSLLLGDVEAKVRGGVISGDQARRLWQAMPLTLAALVDYAPDLIGTFVVGQVLLARATAVAGGESAWLSRLQTVVGKAAGGRLDQQRLFEQVTALLHAIAAQQPLLLILEDLHWADASSISLLFHLCRESHAHPILIVGTYRHNEVALGWNGQPHPLIVVMAELKRYYGEIWLDLAAVDVVQGRHFVDAYLDSQPNRLDGSFRQLLFTQTAGHPLFTVELLRAMQGLGALRQDKEGRWLATEAIDWQKLPAKIEGVIERRLAALDADLRQVLTIASVEGDAFTAEVIAQVQGCDARSLVRRLSSEVDRQHYLVSAQSLEQVGEQRLASYRFRHHLFQMYLYQHLDASERAYLHEAVGAALEKLYGDQVAEIAASLAHHFQVAGRVGKAIHYWQIAAQSAMRKSAYSEAITHLRLALTLLTTLPKGTERDPQELTLQLILGQALIAVKGYGVPEVAQAFNAARQLCGQITDVRQIFPILYGLHTYYFTRAEHRTARQLAEQMWSLAQAQPALAPPIMAHRALGLILLQTGEFAPAQQHLAQVISLYDAAIHHPWVLQYGGIDSGVISQATIAFALWYLGYPDQMLKCVDASIVLAERLAHPFSLAAALGFASFAHQFRHEVSQCKARAEEVIALCRQQKFPLWIPLATCLQGWAWVEEGEAAAGLAQMQQGLDALRSTGTELLRPRCLALLAEAYGRVGQVEAAILAVREALKLVETTGERSHEAELYRLHGELLRQKGDEVQAEVCYLRAIQVAQQQSAKAWELRAVMSLCRLWQKQGKEAEARSRLAEIVGWFTEGFETADVIEARTLLVVLG